jgi:hypothetical protein
LRRQNQRRSETGLVGSRRADLRLCHRLWPFCQVGIGAVEGQHPLDVALREALLLGELVVQVAGQSGNHAGAPALLLLASVNGAADLPVEPNQLGIDGQHCPRLGLANPLTDLAQQGRVVDRQGRQLGHDSVSAGSGSASTSIWPESRRGRSRSRVRRRLQTCLVSVTICRCIGSTSC